MSTSSSCLVLTETDINKTEILNIPYTEEEEHLELSSNEKILQEDVLKYFVHLGKAISHKSAGHVFYQNVKEDHLEQFGIAFCDVLNEIYSKNNKSWQIGSVAQTDLYTVYQFGFGKNGELSYNYGNLLENDIKILVENKLSNKGIIYTRVIRIYKHINGFDCVFFIKPNAKHYWLKSIALRDADDTFVDLKKAGF